MKRPPDPPGRRVRRAAAPRVPPDINAVIAGYLRDMAFIQTATQKTYAWKRAAAAILWLERPANELAAPDGTLPKIAGIGPASTRIIREVLEHGTSGFVEAAVEASGRREDIERRRGLRERFLSRAVVLAVLNDPELSGPTREMYRGDLQMHSEWSDGAVSVADMAAACVDRGYQFAAVTDHSYGLKIAGGMTMADAREQRESVKAVNKACGARFRMLHGVEANIGGDGALDLSDDEAGTFDLVLAAPHSRLRGTADQTERMIAAVKHPRVRILAHPRGRQVASRAGIAADWDTVFSQAARRGVAIEIDGDPSRQDVDYDLARRALDAGCLFALDSDAHSPRELVYAETALAHARLAAVPPDRIVNCWPLERLLAWIRKPLGERPG
jgi:putative hydrolase